MEPYPHFHSPPSMCVCAQWLCDPMDYSPLSFSVHGISQARILEGLPFPSPEGLPNSGIKPTSPASAGGFFTTELPGKPLLLFKSPSSWYFVTAALRNTPT